MRLGIFLDEWRDGGVPVFLDRLEQFLTEEGHEVYLFLANPHQKRDKLSKELYALIKARLGDRCVSLELGSFPVAWRTAHFRQTILSHGIACLLLNYTCQSMKLMETISSEVPLISVAHNDCDFYYFEFLRSIEFTRAHVCVSKRILEKTLLLTPPALASRIKYICYGVEESAARFRPAPDGPLRVIYCARLDPIQKRCHDLVPVWKDYLRQGGTGKLVILGYGKNDAFLRAQFRDEMAAGNVTMLGHVTSTEALNEIARGDVILNLSNFEGLPQVVIEGASLGLYPLLSDIESGHREIIEALGTGMTCHVGDTGGFVRELCRLEKELPSLRQERVRIRNAALRHYSLRASCLKYLEVMREVGLAAPVPIRTQMPARPLPEWISRARLLIRYRRHFRH